MFKYSEDRIPVAIILTISCIDFCLYFLINNVWVFGIYWAVMIVPKGKVCSWNHHHQHTHTFRNPLLNRLLEFFYALHSGVTTNLWVLHHVLGHHENYLDQSLDESRWKKKNSEEMGEFEYTFNVAASAYYRGYQVGKSHPEKQKKFLIFSAITFSIVFALVFYKPVAGLFLFVLPMVLGLVLTSWATYEHHAGLDTQKSFEASNNNIHPFFNLVTGNLGYHTAHHYKQWVHWSKLPALHEVIKDKIPPQLIKSAWF
jgi:fatty acid desaturase